MAYGRYWVVFTVFCIRCWLPMPFCPLSSLKRGVNGYALPGPPVQLIRAVDVAIASVVFAGLRLPKFIAVGGGLRKRHVWAKEKLTVERIMKTVSVNIFTPYPLSSGYLACNCDSVLHRLNSEAQAGNIPGLDHERPFYECICALWIDRQGNGVGVAPCQRIEIVSSRDGAGNIHGEGRGSAGA
jgi:hypothetical protein